MRQMGFDANALLLSMVVSGVGFVAFVYGKRQTRVPQMVAGLVLMVFPYFVSSAGWMLAVAVAVIGLMVAAIKLGL